MPGGGVRPASVVFDGGSVVLLETTKSGSLMRFDASGAHLLTAGGVLNAGMSFSSAGEVVGAILQGDVLEQFDAFGTHRPAAIG